MLKRKSKFINLVVIYITTYFNIQKIYFCFMVRRQLVWDKRSQAPCLDSPETHTYTFFIVNGLERIAEICQQVLEQLGHAYEEPSVLLQGNIPRTQLAYLVYKFDSKNPNFDASRLLSYAKRDQRLGNIQNLQSW